MRWISIVPTVLIIVLPAWADPGEGDKFEYNSTRLMMVQTLSQPQEELPTTSADSVQIEGKLVPGKAVLLSAILPGAGQYYAKSPIMAAAFLAIEIGAWAGVAIYHKEGMDKEDEFKAYADDHWIYLDDVFSSTYSSAQGNPADEFTYLEYEYWVATEFGNPNREGEYAEGLDEWEQLDWDSKLDYLPSNGFTHELQPDEKDQQYYEMIGKYDQFGAGWPDAYDAEDNPFDEDNPWRFKTYNQVRENYLNLRKDSNDALDTSKNFAMVIMGNHLLSALHAGLSVTWHNRKLARRQSVEGAFQLEPKKYNDEFVTMGVLRIRF